MVREIVFIFLVIFFSVVGIYEVSSSGIECVYDGLCVPECMGTNDIDCICIDAGSAECQSALRNLSGKTNYLATASLAFLILFLVFLIAVVSVKIFKIAKRKKSRRNVRELEKKEKGIALKKTELKKDFQKKLKEKEKILNKKESFLDRLLKRKTKAHGKEKQILEKKIEHDKKALTERKTEVKKELKKELKAKESSLESQKTEFNKEKKAVKNKIHQEIRRLLSAGREQLASGNKSEARNIYRKIRKLHATLKSSEKNKELYDRILAFHKRLTE